MERDQRPKEVTIGVAVLALLYFNGLYGAIAGGLLSADSAQMISRGFLSLLVTPLLLLGIWFGVGAARIVSVVLFIGRLVALVSLVRVGATVTLGAFNLFAMAVHAAALVLLFFPASSAWFRSRKQQLRRHVLYPFWLAIGIVFGIPLVLALLATQSGPVMGGAGTVLTIGILYLFLIPAMIFGRPHFEFGIGAAPADATGVVLMIAFYAFIAAVLGAGLWFLRRKKAPVVAGADAKPPTRKIPWTGGIIAAVVLGLLAVMIVPQVRDRSALNDKLQAKVAQEQAKLDATLADYPQLDGTFTILDEGGQYGIKSSGHWKIAKGALEIVADATEIWNRFPKCTDCSRLASWHFVLRSTRKARAPWLGAREQRIGFSPMNAAAGPDGRIVVTGHRMVVPIAEDEDIVVLMGDKRAEGKVHKPLPPGKIADSWIGIELEYTGNSSYPADATNPFMFADALAARGLAPPRCAAPRNIADAVDKACHDELAQMLQDPARRKDIEKGDDDLRTFSKENSPLQVAVWKKDAKSVDLLLENGANPNQTSNTGYTLLMTAAINNADDVVAVLARHKVNVNEQYTKFPGNDAGKTALIMAANQGRTEAIKALLAAGADKSIRDRAGYNALQHAEHFGHPEAAALLK
ncbi:MAG: ankyrin repeat domain-containing protein [Usitatibacter sp.]